MKIQIVNRGGVWHLQKKVPKIYLPVAGRTAVSLSLKTDSESEARRKADKIWRDLLRDWDKALETGGCADLKAAQGLLDKARRDAQRLGLVYRQASEVAELPLADILRRLKIAAPDPSGQIHAATATAALGLAPVPELTLRGAYEDFMELSEPELAGKTEDQRRKWKNPRARSIEVLIEAVGDIPLRDFGHVAALTHRQYLLAWASEEGRSQDTVRKLQLTALGILRKVSTLRGLGLDLKFEGLNIAKGKNPPRRVSVGEEWIKAKWLPGGCAALGGLNAQARQIVLMMINTGCRPSEIAGLKVKHIHLTKGAESIALRADGRTLKTANSSRDMPLAGVSLSAAREAAQAATERGAGPDDWLFPRYAEGDTLSAVAGKYLRANDLLPEGAVLYGLRHGFRDRLDATGIQERVCLDLMGHNLQSPRYGNGGGDEVRRQSIRAIAV